MEAGEPAGIGEEVKESSRPAKPSTSKKSSTASPCLHLLLQNKSHQYPGQTAPSHPICSSTVGTSTGIWQLRPRRTHRARSWHQGSATCQHTFPSSRARLSGICQVPAPWVAEAGPKLAVHRPAGGHPPRPWCVWHSSGTVLYDPATWAAPASTHKGDSRWAPELGTFCLNCFSFASGLLSAGEEFLPRQRRALQPRTGRGTHGKHRFTPSEPAPWNLPLPPGPEVARTFQKSNLALISLCAPRAHTFDVSHPCLSAWDPDLIMCSLLGGKPDYLGLELLRGHSPYTWKAF